METNCVIHRLINKQNDLQKKLNNNQPCGFVSRGNFCGIKV